MDAVQSEDTEDRDHQRNRREPGQGSEGEHEPAIAPMLRLSVKHFEGGHDELTSADMVTSVPYTSESC